MTSVPDRRSNEHWYADYVNVFGEVNSEDEPLFPQEEDVGNVLDVGSMEVGLEFPDKSAFCEHLRAYAVLNGFQFRVKKSDHERMRVVCAHHDTENCDFFVYVTKERGDDHTFIIRGLNLVYRCEGDPLGRNRSANPAFVAAHVMRNLAGGRVVPKVVEIVNEFWRSHNTLLPYHTAWRDRVMVLERLHGSYDESYKFILSLCEMVSRTNPGSVTNFTYGRTDNKFESIMISFAAPLRGFKDGCIKVIGLDACHLYGKHGGCLLAATGLDAQNGLVPLGIFICRNECYENWYLFLKNLKPKIIGRGFTLNFISDRQNGHLFKNFKTHFKGSKLKEHVFNAAKAYKRKHFKVHMNSLLELNQAACEYVMQEHPSTWARSFYDESACCEHMKNNFSESFNNMICKLRDKPVCKIATMYGKLVMGLFYKRRNATATWEDGDLVPTANKLLKKMLKNVGDFKVEGAEVGKLGS
ncbi:uncharacterized protein LOC113306181 [Papaver somniferum]|uniref:uncharacterized protein LOC113306181 n=1 Tax=Papaver somniferum TaxID=3469 RepID=UPI000E6FB0BF|nr:uncharacterized protein LOC113306181 [Papaver somniferum]